MIKKSLNKHIKIIELESIRGLAAILVVFFHLPIWNSILDLGIKKNGYLMVELFFVLSGFVIYNAYGNRIIKVSDLLRFQFLRLGRLYPVHFFFLILFFFIETAKYIFQHNLGLEIKSAAFSENSFTAFLQHLILIQSIGPTHNVATFNFPAWSISVEFYTYLLFGVVTLIARKKIIIVFMLIAILSLLLLGIHTTFGFNELLRCFAGFFTGSLTAIIVTYLRIKSSKYFSLLIFISIIGYLQFKPLHQYDLMIYFLTSVLIISLVTCADGILNKFLNLKPLVWLGGISYAIYMSHALVIWFFELIIMKVIHKSTITTLDGKITAQLTTIETLFSCILFLLINLFISSIIYRVIENPWREKSRRFISSYQK